MARSSITPGEWWIGDKKEHLGWVRLVKYQGRDTYVCVTRSERVVGGGDSLRDAVEAFLEWKRSQVGNELRPNVS